MGSTVSVLKALQENLLRQAWLPKPARRGLNLLRRVPRLSLIFGESPIEPAVSRFYSEYIVRDDVVVEVGARMGDGTRVLARLAKYVHAFEPARESFLVLRLFVRGFRNVNAYNVALGDYVGEASLQRDRSFSGVSSIRKLSGVSYASEEGVRVTKLDNLNLKPPPTSMVLDCEGSEAEVLRGAERSLSSIRTVLVETHTLDNGSTTLGNVLAELGRHYSRLRLEHAGNELWVLATR